MTDLIKSIDWKNIAAPLLEYLISGIILYALIPNIGALPKLTMRFIEWAKAKSAHSKNVYISGLLHRATIVVGDHVLLLENTEIELLKEKASKGLISKAELPALLAEVKAKAIAMITQHLKAQDIWKDLLFIFMGSEEGLSKWISNQIETQVATLPPSNLQTTAHVGLAAIEAGELKRSQAQTQEITIPVPLEAAASPESKPG